LDKKLITELDLKEYNEGAFEEFNEAVLVHCPHCARTFSESAFKHHANACTATNPMKHKVYNPKTSNTTSKTQTQVTPNVSSGYNYKFLLGTLATNMIKEEYKDLINPKKVKKLLDIQQVKSPYSKEPIKTQMPKMKISEPSEFMNHS